MDQVSYAIKIHLVLCSDLSIAIIAETSVTSHTLVIPFNSPRLSFCGAEKEATEHANF